MYACIYVYICVCIYICIYTYLSIYMSIYIYVYVYMYVYVYAYMYIYMYMCIRVYMYICIHICLYMYVCVYAGAIFCQIKPQEIGTDGHCTVRLRTWGRNISTPATSLPPCSSSKHETNCAQQRGKSNRKTGPTHQPRDTTCSVGPKGPHFLDDDDCFYYFQK